ncbi:unnamed protein product [Closterium sp. Naga37s-1]|nr:unnamed protein product [Closterium sp. Naga37s-1]
MHLPIAVGEGEVVGGRGGVREGSEESSGSEGGEEEIVDVCDSVREWGEEGRFEQGQLEEGRLEGKSEGNIGGKGKEVGGSEREQGEEGHFEATVAGKGAMVQVQGGCHHGEGQRERQEGEEGRKSEESEKGKAEGEGEREVAEGGEGQAEQDREECEQGVVRPKERLILGSEDEMLTWHAQWQLLQSSFRLASHNFDAAFFPSLLIVSAIASTLLAVAFAVAPLFEFTDFSTPVVLGVVTAIHLDFALLLLTIAPIGVRADPIASPPLSLHDPPSSPPLLPLLSRPQLWPWKYSPPSLLASQGRSPLSHLPSSSRPLSSPHFRSVSYPVSPYPLHPPRPPSSLSPLQSALISICADSIAPPPLSLHDPPSAAPLLPRLSRPQLWPDRGAFQPRSSMLPTHWNHPKRHAA